MSNVVTIVHEYRVPSGKTVNREQETNKETNMSSKEDYIKRYLETYRNVLGSC